MGENEESKCKVNEHKVQARQKPPGSKFCTIFAHDAYARRLAPDLKAYFCFYLARSHSDLNITITRQCKPLVVTLGLAHGPSRPFSISALLPS